MSWAGKAERRERRKLEDTGKVEVFMSFKFSSFFFSRSLGQEMLG
jgi:hypothetical protein